MFRRREKPPIAPRDGHLLVVGIVARISGCPNQKERSLEDQVDHAKQVVAEYYEGKVDYRTIATRGKGERLDRPELTQILQLLRKDELDLLIVEDIGRLVRGAEAVRLCGIAVDHGTRVLSPNDHIDTAEDSWEDDVMDTCRQHVSHNVHTSKRLKHKLMNRFVKFGGATPLEIFGYIVPDDAETLDDWRKDESATPFIVEGARRLRASLNCTAVSEWFNAQCVSVGPYCRREKWDGNMIRRFFNNPLLKGMPERGNKHTIKHYETGRRISVKNVDGAETYACPHLAHLDPLVFDELKKALDARNSRYARKRSNGTDPLYRRPRKRTLFPGGNARCWYCGRALVWGANGIMSRLMCAGVRDWKCWNSVGVPGSFAADRIVEAIVCKLYEIDDFSDQFARILRQAREDPAGNLAQRWTQLKGVEVQLAKERKNLKEAIAQLGLRPVLQETLEELEGREKQLAQDRRLLEQLERKQIEMPESTEEMRALLLKEFERQTKGTPEFGDFLRPLIPEFWVFLVRLCDGGHLFPRARIKLNLAGSFPDIERFPGLQAILSSHLTVDLFDNLPEREMIRPAAVQLSAQGFTLRQIAAHLPSTPTSTAVGNALALQRKMDALGLKNPLEIVSEPVADYPKMRRHLNSKFEFTSLEGYLRPPLE